MTDVVRLSGIEVYKYFITPSTKWVLIVSVFVSSLAAIGAAWLTSAEGSAPTLNGAVAVAALPVGLLIPINAILVFCSDWHHRDVMTFLSLARGRAAFFAAKLVAAVGLAALIVLATLLVAAFAVTGFSAARGATPDFSFGEPVGLLWVAVVGGTLAGAALGSAIMSTALAVTVMILQMIVLDPILGFLPNGVGDYLRSGTALGGWQAEMGILAFVSSAALWIVAPLAIGFVRFLTREP
ncbi:hypothetical protein DZF92_02455 [Clavibacter michiganensis subsp. insidiosus]|uniref:Uncharacterized protein n=1 Tax=Clavibacter michiganensis subsp. insidiosus TaxID=33014 RepID=A0A399SNK5_9MICO|nr:hypothetical protein [Clavibacter michiganensis]AWG00274.1 hypothetical protein BEH62_01515 [Clavibacter michiganensis subsp. insidiosus]OQJ61082.1 hypothetical protein B5P21_15055 [Clavibacter michiganensis subsp. insidiosus]RII88593.1 hypothetical protein DZF92_02455 [Clavibacter michiganensis subsp. insidiosus]RIJ44898.1 hypothetical protein DZF93_01070 [Clavibacter michiganensis subsp. insidiosus]RMC85775.1 hypothetical protein CmiCFBP2404_06595 [Clavibacter michiganensis subsp. insidio